MALGQTDATAMDQDTEGNTYGTFHWLCLSFRRKQTLGWNVRYLLRYVLSVPYLITPALIITYA